MKSENKRTDQERVVDGIATVKQKLGIRNHEEP